MKKKKINKGILKISEYDRIQGLTWNKQFFKDLKKTIFPLRSKPNQKAFHIQKIQAFENKYKISLPPPECYNTVEECIEEIRKYPMLYSENEAIRLIPTGNFNLQEIKVTNNVRKKLFPKSRTKDKVSIYESTGDPFSPFIIDGKYIIVIIDFTKDKTKIIDMIKDTIRKCSPENDKKSKGRNKDTLYNIWEVYRLRHKEKLNLSQIAKEITKIKKLPSNIDIARDTTNKQINIYKRLKAAEEAVRTACNKAAKIIEQSIFSS